MNAKSEGAAPAAPPRSARQLAARVVHQVFESGAFLSEVLDRELARSGLSDRDRALATELCYGVVRFERALRGQLGALAPRGVAEGDPLAQAHLLVAAYQLSLLDRVPAFAAINEAVSLISELRGPRVGGFANAVLRRLAASERKLSRRDALLQALEPWLRDELSRAVGTDALPALLGGEGEHAHRGLCVRLTARADAVPEWLAQAQAGKLSPRARWLAPSGDVRRLPGYAEGQFVVQEEGSQWAALALGARPGDRVLDACAGHGAKAALLAEQLAPEALCVNDISSPKLERLRREFERLELPAPRCHTVDLSRGTGDLTGPFDRILIDAPCTGTGTLRRRPEIVRRLVASDAQRLAEQSLRLLAHAAELLRPGGRLVFVVCSVLASECEGVVERCPSLLEPVPFDAPDAVALVGASATRHRLLPSSDGTDGYFVASFARRAH